MIDTEIVLTFDLVSGSSSDLCLTILQQTLESWDQVICGYLCANCLLKLSTLTTYIVTCFLLILHENIPAIFQVQIIPFGVIFYIYIFLLIVMYFLKQGHY